MRVEERQERIATETDAAPAGPAELTIELEALAGDAGAGTAAAKAESGDAEAAAAEPAKTERLELFAATPENLVPVRTGGRDTVLLIQRETRDQIVAKLQAVRDAKAATEESVEDPEETPAVE